MEDKLTGALESMKKEIPDEFLPRSVIGYPMSHHSTERRDTMATEQERNRFLSDRVIPSWDALLRDVAELQERVAELETKAPMHFTPEANPETGEIEFKPKKAGKKAGKKKGDSSA